jgi:DNA-binding MarR family transcriptional regulator
MIPSVRKADADTMALWSHLLRAHRHLTARLDEELRAVCGMTLDEYDVLYQARRVGGAIRMTDLADRLLVSRASTSRLVDRLVGRGWLDRWHDDADRRVVLVDVTDAGRREQARAGRVHVDGIARLVADPLAGHDRGAIAAALAVLADDR